MDLQIAILKAIVAHAEIRLLPEDPHDRKYPALRRWVRAEIWRAFCPVPPAPLWSKDGDPRCVPPYLRRGDGDVTS